jgi:hypothetical protein
VALAEGRRPLSEAPVTACGACATVQSSNVSIVLRRAGAYGGDFKTKPE